MPESAPRGPRQGTPVPGVAVPPVLPEVQLTIADSGEITATIDGVDFPPPQFAPPWRRIASDEVLRALSTHLDTAFRLVITEHDGTTFTDIVTRPTSSQREVSAPPHNPPVVLRGQGFEPGEDVAIAVFAGFATADDDGVCAVSVDADRATDWGDNDVIIVGRISHRIVKATRHPPRANHFRQDPTE